MSTDYEFVPGRDDVLKDEIRIVRDQLARERKRHAYALREWKKDQTYWVKFLENGIEVINDLIAKSDCSVDRNEEFYAAAQWKEKAKAFCSRVSLDSDPAP